MGKTTELSINVVSMEMRKLLLRIQWSVIPLQDSGCVITQDHRRIDRPCLSRVTFEERGKPAFLPSGRPTARKAVGNTGMGCRRKQMPICNESDTPTSGWSDIRGSPV